MGFLKRERVRSGLCAVYRDWSSGQRNYEEVCIMYPDLDMLVRERIYIKVVWLVPDYQQSQD